MICNNCGAEIDHILIDKFQYDGTDRDELTVLEDLGDNCYGIATDHNWTGDELDEAILHAEEVAEEQEKALKDWQECKNRSHSGWSESDIASVDTSIVNCRQCAKEHRQLAEWLKDYKRLLEQDKWLTATQNASALEKAYGKGYYDALQRREESGVEE